jgi:isopenicillin N synthase-like dioxygenase
LITYEFFKIGFCSLSDISPLVTKIDDPKLATSDDVLDVVRQLDGACKEAGFFYVVKFGYFYLLL